jgi:hypothetical protein
MTSKKLETPVVGLRQISTPRLRLSTIICGLLLICLSFALPLDSSPASAQPAEMACQPPPANREIHVGGCIRSSIGPEDPKNETNTPYEDWRLNLEAGETVQIDMDAIPTLPRTSAEAQPSAAAEPFALDTFLELRRDGARDPLATNDDRPGSLDSRIGFTAPATDHYVVRARPLAAGEGDYQLRVSRPPPPPVPTALATGRTHIVFENRPSGESRLFSFDGAEGEIVRVSLDAGVMANARMRLLAQDDQLLGEFGELGRSWVLIAILPRTGPYQLRLQMASGAAILNFERRASGSAHPPRPIQIGATSEGEIGYDSSVGLGPYGDGQMFYEFYELRLQAGQTVTVTLESQVFDTVLDAGTMSALGFAAARTNDDFGAGLNSRLVLRPEQSGPILLRVRALGNGFGAFHISVRPGDASAPSAPVAR